MPSPTELQSIATLEAMAQGCAVLAADYDTSAVPELVGNAGLCYDPERLPAAASNISRLLDAPDELQRFRENAARAAKAHDIRESARSLEEIYSSIIRARSGPHG